jgi:polyisoprenoid-binding protein YceI
MKRWSIDPDHSAARFSVRHFTIADVEGLFPNLTGTIRFDPPDLNTLAVEAEMEVKSLTTGNPERDEHLLSADYFDAGTYPKILFQSTATTPTGENRANVAGDLTIRGIKKPVILEVQFSGPVKSPFSGITCVGFSATGRVIRSEYGMTWNVPMEHGGVVTALEVAMHMEVEADLMTD